MNIEKLLIEWAYRCDAGYPNLENYSDMYHLQSILDEWNIQTPFPRLAPPENVLNEALSKDGQEVLNVMSNPKIGIRDEAFGRFKTVLASLPPDKQKIVKLKLRSFTLEQFIGGGWEFFKEFFDVNVQGFGRGELMCLMAIAGSTSGGTAEKDLRLPDGKFWEIKEDPTGIRMAQSGTAQKFKYVQKIKKFYDLLSNIHLNDKSQDKTLVSQLKLIFKNDKIAEEVYKTLANNFRGDMFKNAGEEDGEAGTQLGMFERISTANEIPKSVIQMHLDGFIKLNSYRKIIMKNPDILANSKLILKSADKEDGYWITSVDAAKLQNAKPDSSVEIQKGAKITKGTKELLYSLVDIMNFEYSKKPSQLPADIAERRDIYFSDIEGYIYFFKKKPKPFIGHTKDFAVYGISQGQGKMRLSSMATTEFEKMQNK